ncbi:MAG: MFS transporter [Candidatus Humimicrobiaceae bacterium]
MQQRDSFKDYLLEIPNYLSIFIFPLFILTLSPILLDISASTGIKTSDFNLVFTFFTIGSITGQLTSVLYNKRFNSLSILVASFIVLIPVTFTLSQITGLFTFYILYFISGYFMGVIWLQANTNIMRSRIKNKDRLISVALSFYPIGAFLSPYISSSIVSRGIDWQVLYYILIFLIIIIIILYLIITRRIGYMSIKNDQKISFKEIFTNKTKNILFILMAVMLGVYAISETVIATWAPTFFRSERSFNISDAALVVSLYWGGILVGRVITGILSGKLKTNYLILILSSIGLISAISIYFVDNKNIILIIAFVVGLGYSAIFPLLVSSGSNIYKLGSGVLLTILFASANLGLSLAPFMTRFFSRFNMTISISLAPIFMMIFIIISISLIIYSRRSNIVSKNI